MVLRSPLCRPALPPFRRGMAALFIATGCGFTLCLPPTRLMAAEGVPAAGASTVAVSSDLEHAIAHRTCVVTATAANVSREGAGVVVAPGELLTSSSLLPASELRSFASGAGAAPAAEAGTDLKITVRVGFGKDAKTLPATLAWVSPTEDLALLKVTGLTVPPERLDLKAAAAAGDTVYALATEPASNAAETTAAPALISGVLGAAPAEGLQPLTTAAPASAIEFGAPLFSEHGHWVGVIARAADGKPACLNAEHLDAALFGAIRTVKTSPENFNVAAGGKLTVEADVPFALTAPRTITVQAGEGPAARPVPLHRDSKTGLYEGTLTLTPAPSDADRPVDEAKLPANTKLNYKMDPNCMVGKRSNATADSLYTGDFINKYVEITGADNHPQRIYFSALVHATFTSDSTATVLTTDNRTLTGKLSSKFTYMVSGMAGMKWTCGAEQITYVEVPGAKAVDKKSELVLKLTGTAADGNPLPAVTTTLH